MPIPVPVRWRCSLWEISDNRHMREKKNYRIFTFQTTTDAMAMEKQCIRNEIPGRMIPVPREISAACGLAWRMEADRYPLYEEKIRKLGLEFHKSVEIML